MDPIMRWRLNWLTYLKHVLKMYIPQDISSAPCDACKIEHSLVGTQGDISDISCACCKLPFWILDRVKSIVANRYAQMLVDCSLKCKLYMGHCVRVYNQRRRLEFIKENLNNNQALLLLDFKMKFEPLFYREKTS